jgi:dihydroorotate dehydrogenase (fumarate)
MDLTTSYLGKKLHTPLVASASPLSESIDNIKKLEDAGIGAIVMYSLFEEQIEQEEFELHYHMEHGTESFAEALSYFPETEGFKSGTEGYLEHIHYAKSAVDIPIIASLNGNSLGGWTDFAELIQEAGADALELNIYDIPTDMDLPGSEVEDNYIKIVESVKEVIDIPVAVKLSPYYSNMANMAKRYAEAGADALVLFNRFYQPDINLETMEVVPNVRLSTAQALRLPLRWIAILHGKIDVDFAATSGVHDAEDVIKLLMVGANVTMMASALLRHGIDHVRVIETGVKKWMEENEYDSINLMQGSMSQKNMRNATAYERAQYMRAISTIPDEALASFKFRTE